MTVLVLAAAEAKRQREAEDPAAFARSLGFSPDDWQQSFLQSHHPRKIVLACRQSGKSTCCAAAALHRAIYFPESLVLLTAPTLRQSSELFRKVREFYARLRGAPRIVEESVLRYTFSNGSRIVSLPGTPGTVRGFSRVSLLIIDEAAQIDEQLSDALSPMLAVGGGDLVMISSAWMREGVFYKTWVADNDWQKITVDVSQIPRISPEFLEQERKQMVQAVFLREYFNVFDAAEMVAFDPASVERAFKDVTVPDWYAKLAVRRGW